ncbi:hypothetical protein [Acinetobacter pittii]|uniref:Uncharacterized protein n=1 Tax=Acinetobacter pittii TaxID=48296 RepID=A0AAE9M8D8_ACIPI|nr:hypothetical protein [Acinetobacter pittii]USU94146.1 hypothetical protein MWH18_17710 [Acinetobacter pittii]
MDLMGIVVYGMLVVVILYALFALVYFLRTECKLFRKRNKDEVRMKFEGTIEISFKDECNCVGCFYTRKHGGYMPCQKNCSISINKQNKPINGQPVQPPKKP